MIKLYTPTYHAKNIYEIPLSFFAKYGYKILICDLDNTLDAFDTFSPTEKAKKLKKDCDELGLKLIIISNNHSKRVINYANELNVPCLSNARKPFKFKVVKYLKENKINRNHVILIGDQTVTDIICANKSKISSILVDKLVERDQPTTKFNRIFDKRFRKKLEKKGLLREIGE